MTEQKPPPSDDFDSRDARRRPAGAIFQKTLAECRDELFGMLFFLTGDTEEAREAMTDTLRKCWRHRRGAVESLNLRTWVFRVAISVARDFRSSSPRRHWSLSAQEADALAENDPGREGVPPQTIVRLRQAVSRLRTLDREVFLLRQNGRLTYPEIAQALNMDLGTVKTRMRFALRRMRESLEPRSDRPRHHHHDSRSPDAG